MGKARRPITASPLSPNHSAPRHPTGQIPEESTEAHQPRRDFNWAVHRIIYRQSLNMTLISIDSIETPPADTYTEIGRVALQM